MSHFIERCRFCYAVIAQCRCGSLAKEERLGVCETCKTVRAVRSWAWPAGQRDRYLRDRVRRRLTERGR